MGDSFEEVWAIENILGQCNQIAVIVVATFTFCENVSLGICLDAGDLSATVIVATGGLDVVGVGSDFTILVSEAVSMLCLVAKGVGF